MKGTLYSSDYVKHSDETLKLLEFNTDTDFPSASLSHFDWSSLENVITSESIAEVHVIYKEFQKHLVTNFSESLHNNSDFTGSWHTQLETQDTIYPTDITDGDDKFILRCAYNEAAIFDSTYCKSEINLYELFTTASSESFVIPHYVSSSAEEYVYDGLLQEFNNTSVPDLAIKSQGSTDGPSLHFYKIASSSLSPEVRYTSFISELYNDGEVISNYVDTSEGDNHMKSVRSCNVIYGSDLKICNIGNYKISSWVDKPSNLITHEQNDDTFVLKVDNKHRYEFATNWPKEYWKNQHGIYQDSELIDSTTDSIVKAKDTIVDNRYKSMDIVGLPDTDDSAAITNWSISGNTLPSGTSITSSVLVSKESASIEYGIVTEISTSLDASVVVGNSLPILVYNIDDDKIEFEYSYNITTGSYQVFDGTGSLHNIVENNLIILDTQDKYTYELNMETDDTYVINDSGVLLTAHNPFYTNKAETCFLAGAQVVTTEETKNIEDIVVGDTVQAWNDETKKFVPANVTAIDHRHTVGDHLAGCNSVGYGEPGVFKLINSEGDDFGFRFTPEHPFLTKDGWKALAPLTNQEPWVSQQTDVKILEVGDFLKFDNLYKSDDGIDGDGKWEEISEIQFEPLPSNTSVYNITVEGVHTYLVNYVVVHNK